MLENLTFSPIHKKSVSLESSSVFKEKKRIRGFNFMNIRKKQDSFLKEMLFQTSFPIKNIKSFDFKQKKEKILTILSKKMEKKPNKQEGEERKKIKSFNFRQNVKSSTYINNIWVVFFYTIIIVFSKKNIQPILIIANYLNIDFKFFCFLFHSTPLKFPCF